MVEWRRMEKGEYPGVNCCPECDEKPFTQRWAMTQRLFHCCGSPAMTRENWNLYTQEHRDEVDGEPTPEEDEAFQELERKNNPDPEWPLASMGRSFERFGQLLQDRNSTVVDLVEAARDAGFNLRVGVQPEVEETTDEHTTA